MPAIDFRQARAEVQLAEVLRLLGHAPRRRGPCPVHGSRSPRSRSFAAELERNLWYCFRCRRGGNALDLWIAVTGHPLHEAVLDLYRRLGHSVPWLDRRIERCATVLLKES